MPTALITGASSGIGLEIARIPAVDHVVAVPGLQNKLLAASIRSSPRPVVCRLVHTMQAAK